MKLTNVSFTTIVRRHASKPALALFLITSLLTGCKDDDDTPPVNEEELITTINLKLTENGTANAVTASFRDIDGPGGAAPTFTELILKPNTLYNAEITVLDESKTPAEDITAEIEEEKEDHQFFYSPTNVNLTVAYDDLDDNNLPIGLKTKITTGAASTGKLKVTLKHQPGLKNNNIATGETDIEVEFNSRVQ